jgi:hypothetical protein
MISVCLLNFTLQYTFLFKLEILIHNFFCQVKGFIMHLWHLNRINFLESPKKDQN